MDRFGDDDDVDSANRLAWFFFLNLCQLVCLSDFVEVILWSCVGGLAGMARREYILYGHRLVICLDLVLGSPFFCFGNTLSQISGMISIGLVFVRGMYKFWRVVGKQSWKALLKIWAEWPLDQWLDNLDGNYSLQTRFPLVERIGS